MEETTIELIVKNDEGVIKEIEHHFTESQVTRGRKSRAIDPVIALAVAAGVLKLINELLTLREKLMKTENAPDVIVRNTNGKTASLKEDTPEKIRLVVTEK